MYEFIKIQYELGNLTKEQVYGFTTKWLTKKQADEIIGE